MKSWNKGIYILELGKSNSLKLPEEITDVVAVGGVSNQLKFQSIIRNKDELIPVLFSDAHATDLDTESQRNDINILKRKNTFLQIDTCNFDEIKSCLKDRERIAINSDLLRDVIEINGHRVSTGLNLIIGKRGTGKTHFLESIKNEYSEDDIYEIAQFETANSKEYIENHRKKQGLKSFNNWKSKYSIQFNSIQEYINSPDINVTKGLEDYLVSLKNRAKDLAKSNSKSMYLLTKEASFEIVTKNSLKGFLKSLEELITNPDFWEHISNSKDRKKVFVETYSELRQKFIKHEIEVTLKEKVNIIIEEIKDIQNAKIGISKVDDMDFTNTIHRLKTQESIDFFLNQIIKEDVISSEDIHGYKIIVKVAPYKNAQQFQSLHSIREAVNDDLIKPYKERDFITFLKNLKNKQFYKPSNLIEYLMHREVDLLDSQGTPASGGQAVGFALMLRLKDASEKNIILIDEPEASLDNDFLKNELIEAIRNLKNNSTVFVITHNSTLGALLNPDYLIITKKSDINNYKVLTGSFISKRISDKSDTLDSFDLFVEAMEAGMDTYFKKGEIYGNLKDK